MTGRTIDETGRDINERQPEPEPIKPGWYWTGRYIVWVIGPSANGRGVYYQTGGTRFTAMKNTTCWQRVHEQVKESGQGFGWRPRSPNH